MSCEVVLPDALRHHETERPPRALHALDRLDADTIGRQAKRFAGIPIRNRPGLEPPDPTQPYRERLAIAGIVGQSQGLANVLREMSVVVPFDVDVLLTGPSGTGKSQIARAIHENSPRAERPLVEINCAAIPESLVESELFGALPGAHSTATRRIEGKVGTAHLGGLIASIVTSCAEGSFQEATRRFQTSFLHHVLEDTGWSVPEAATRLGLARSYVYALIRGFGLKPGPRDRAVENGERR